MILPILISLSLRLRFHSLGLLAALVVIGHLRNDIIMV
jgi:hypothetical protein